MNAAVAANFDNHRHGHPPTFPVRVFGCIAFIANMGVLASMLYWSYSHADEVRTGTQQLSILSAVTNFLLVYFWFACIQRDVHFNGWRTCTYIMLAVVDAMWVVTKMTTIWTNESAKLLWVMSWMLSVFGAGASFSWLHPELMFVVHNEGVNCHARNDIEVGE